MTDGNRAPGQRHGIPRIRNDTSSRKIEGLLIRSQLQVLFLVTCCGKVLPDIDVSLTDVPEEASNACLDHEGAVVQLKRSPFIEVSQGKDVSLCDQFAHR